MATEYCWHEECWLPPHHDDDHAYMPAFEPEPNRGNHEILRCIYCQRTIAYPATEVWPSECVHCGRGPGPYTAERRTGENDNMLIGNSVEGTTPAEQAAWDLRTDTVWQQQVADTDRLIACIQHQLGDDQDVYFCDCRTDAHERPHVPSPNRGNA